MADLAVVAASVGRSMPNEDFTRSFIALEAITRGQAVYIDPTTGKVGIADANAAGKQQFRGVAMHATGAGQAVDVVHFGLVSGFDLSGLSYDALVYLSDTAGALADAVGTMTVPAGRVSSATDDPTTKLLLIDTNWLADWA